jgi:hypothetical protein
MRHPRPTLFHGILILVLLFLLNLQFAQALPPYSDIVAGGSKGLYLVSNNGQHSEVKRLLDGISVFSMTQAPNGLYFVTSKGILYSEDLKKFEDRSKGLPRKVLRVPSGGSWILIEEPVLVKALAIDSKNENRLALCTDTDVWFSDSAGKSWISMGSPSTIPGMRSIAFGPSESPGSQGVWVSHSLRGVYFRNPDDGKGWIERRAGVPRIFGNNIEEVSAFISIGRKGSNQDFLAGLSFLQTILRWDENAKAFVEAYSNGLDFGSVESFSQIDDYQALTMLGSSLSILTFDAAAKRIDVKPVQDFEGIFNSIAREIEGFASDAPACLAFLSGKSGAFVINEAWRLNQGALPSTRANPQKAQQGFYLQTAFVIDPQKREFYFSLMKAKGLDHIVIDVKDDLGKLRFSPVSPLLSQVGQKGAILDLENLSKQAKDRGIYLVARIVVFKDEALYTWNKGRLAVRDAVSGEPWRGVFSNGQPVREYWVDPYAPEVWEYNVEIAREVLARGFDEVQFDYIRFPTDGINLDRARYPAISPGMNQDSALESFLRYARTHIDAPISVDIYGANGWYRSGTRTGQNVEMLVEYVDVICPMLYPSHFEQEFLAFAPPELRPYRIYRLGTLRNLAIARNKVLIRPYVQAFYLDVAYDRKYYNTRYVLEEIRGVREGANQGMTFWNNSGRYDDIPTMR